MVNAYGGLAILDQILADLDAMTDEHAHEAADARLLRVIELMSTALAPDHPEWSDRAGKIVDRFREIPKWYD